jgi:RND family efflux transporter MFP subunit
MRSVSTVVALGAVAFALAGCGKKTPPPAPPTPQVTVAAPLVQNVVDWDDAVGRFEAPQQVEVRSRASGYLQTAHFREGQFVRKGQILFTLDARPAQAQLAAARAQAAQASAQLALARSDLARAQTLVAAQAISREEFDTRRATLAQQQAALQAAQAAIRARALDVEFTRVAAPISGTVSDRRVDPGNLVAGGTSQGDVLTTIVASDPIHFVFESSEAQLLKYQRQNRSGRPVPIQVRLQDEADYRRTGQLDFSDNALDRNSGAVRMRALVANGGGFIKPGMFGNARLQGSGAYPAMLIPDAAVVTDGARKVAYVVGRDGTLAAHTLVLGPISGGLRVVRSGLKAGDQVVINGLQRARPGQKVKAVAGRIERSTSPEIAAPTTLAPPSAVATDAGPAR